MDLFLHTLNMQCYIGCSGFYNKDWKGKFYPEKLAQNKWFEFYCTQFNALELNTTFYRFPTVEMLQKWYDKSPADFRFSVKAPRLITHYKQFNETDRLLDDFYTSVGNGLKQKAGTILFQLPARIIYSEEMLQSIIQQLNKNFINVIEFRHTSWWNENVFTTLAQYNISLCGISIQNLQDNIAITTPTIYYRFHGIDKLYFSQYPIETIQQFATGLQQQHFDAAYIFFNNTATIAAINNATQLQSFLGLK